MEDVRNVRTMEAVVDRPAETFGEPAGLAAPPQPPARPLRSRRVFVFVFTAAGLAMVPWLFVLAAILPATTVVPHYWIAWVGLDGVEAAGLFCTGRLLARGDRRYALTATVTATALLVDAWFDVLGSSTDGQLALSVAMALCAELPIAAVCGRLALSALRPDPVPGSPADPTVQGEF
jgi:hypothetical protein